MLHTAFILSVRGIPQLYTGEEIAMQGGADPDNRRDFPGGFPGDKHSAFTTAGRTPEEQRMWQWTHDWIMLRREHSSIRHGRLIDLFYNDDVYVYAREDANEIVIIALNRSAAETKITIPAAVIGVKDGAELAPLYGTKRGARVAKSETVLIVPARTAAAYAVK
jgi:glycosidase